MIVRQRTMTVYFLFLRWAFFLSLAKTGPKSSIDIVLRKTRMIGA